MPSAQKQITIARTVDIPEGQARVFPAAELRIAVCRVAGKLYAVEDLCTHDEGPLGEGKLHGHDIECPRHGARFDVRDGKVTRMPAAFPVRVFPVYEKDGQVIVEIEP